MKKFWVIGIAAIAALSVTGTVLAAQSGQLQNQAKVKETALNIQPGIVEEIDLEQKQGKLVYEVEIEHQQGEAEVHIDAISGEVVTVKQDEERKSAISTVNQVAPKADTANATKYTENSQTSKQEQRLTKQQAIDSALKHVQGKVTEVELDKDDGSLVYEVEIKNKNVEAEFDIDAYTGEILSKDIDHDDDDDDDDYTRIKR